MMGLRIAGWALALAVVSVGGSVLAADGGGLTCATTHTVECDGTDEECHQGGGEEINFPQFFRVDFEKRELQILDHGRREEVTEVTHLARSESKGRVILQGVEDGRPWSMMITEESGRFSLVINEDDAAFVVFGGCTIP